MAKKSTAEPTTAQTEEERYKAHLERLKKLRPIDDILMREMFRNDLELTQLVLRIIIGNDDLIVTKEETQYDLKSLVGSRSLELDVYATDSENRLYNIEVQRADEGAGPYRGRFHSSGLDVETLKANEDFNKLKITYVIFITENDIFGEGRPRYHFVRKEVETNKPLGDDTHIMYINGAYKNAKDKSDLAKLIHDFTCSKADNMYIDLMANKARQYKETKKGEKRMCKVMEDLRIESEARGEARGGLMAKQQTAIKMIKIGKLSLKDIAEYTDLPLKEVEDLAKKYGSAPAQTDPSQ